MFDSDNIEGVEVLRKEIPENIQYWNRFGRISELYYSHLSDESGEYVCCIDMTLADTSDKYRIKLTPFNVSGKISFDMVNGFYSGFSIDDLTTSGCERDCRFHIYSSEQDIGFDIYCERIKAVLTQ